MTVYLSEAQVLFIHARLIDETGGAHGVRDVGLLAAAVARCQATFDGADLYPDLWHKAAALLVSLANNHPFVDGNKRTALSAAGMMLIVNGYRLTATNDAAVALMMAVAQGAAAVDEAAVWLQNYSAVIEN